MTVGANTLSIGGTLARTSGSIDATNGSATVVLNSASAQTIPASTFTGNVNNLTINNSAGVTLSQSVTIPGTLTLTSGNLTLGSSNLTLAASHAVGGTPSASNHIVTNGTGYVTTTAAFSSAYTFPIGFTTANYNPVVITPSAQTPTIKVQAIGTATTSLTNSLKAQWVIGGLTSSSTVVSFPWNSTNDISASAPLGGIVYNYSGSAWVDMPSYSNTSGSSPSYTTSLTGTTLSNPSTLTVGPNTLPVIGLTSAVGSNTQSVNTVTVITPITYAWSGAATGATVTWTGTASSSAPPNGISVSTSGSVSITGTASDAGTYVFTVTTVGGTGTTSLSGTLSVIAAPIPSIAFASINTVGSSTIYSGSGNYPLTNFSVSVTTSTTALTSVTIPITVSGLVTGDITAYKLFYTATSSAPNYSSATPLATASSSTSSISFSSFSQSISVGTTGYFWVTIDVAPAATSGHAISSSSFTSTALGFSTIVNASGSAINYGTKSVGYPTFYNVANTDVSQLTNWGINTDGSGSNPTSFANTHATFDLYNGASNTLASATVFSVGALNIGDGSAHNATLATSASLTLTTAATIGAGSTLTIGSAATLTVSASSSLTVAGTLLNQNASTAAIVTTGGTLSVGASGVYTLNVGTSGTPATTGQIPTATWNSASTININGYYGSVNVTSSANSTYGNLSINGILSGTMVIWSTAGQNVAGNFIINPAGTYGASGLLQIISSGGTNFLTVGGSYVQHGGNVLLNPSSSTNQRPVVILGNFTIDDAAGNGSPVFQISKGTGNAILILKGNLSLTNTTFSTITASSGSSDVYFAGNNQTVTTSGVTYSVNTGMSLNWHVNSGSNVNLGTAVLGGTTFSTNGAYNYTSITGTVASGSNSITSVSSTAGLQPGMIITGTGIPANTFITSVGVLATSTVTISNNATGGSAGETLTLSTASTSTVQSGHVGGLNGNIATTGTNTLNSGTNYIFNGASAQVSGALLTAANNLTINNSAGVTLSSNTPVTGSLTLTSGTLNTGANSLTISGSLAYTAGNIDASNASATLVFGNSGTTTVSSGFIVGNTVNNLTINNGVTLNTAAVLNVNKALVNNGSITGNGSINLPQQAASQAISGTGSLVNLTLNNTNGASISSGAQSLTGILTVTAGTLNSGTSTPGLVLKSTGINYPTSSAVVGNVCSTCKITGYATVERYIPKGYRAYRDIAPEVYTTTGTIFNNWQAGGTTGSNATTGIFITGANAGDLNNSMGVVDATSANPTPSATSNYLDYSINGIPSCYNFLNASGGSWTSGLTHTDTVLDAFQGYRVLVRGARDFNLYKTPVTSDLPGSLNMEDATTLSATGNLVYGDVTYNTTSGVSATANGSSITVSADVLNSKTDTSFSIVANPYVAPVSWATIYGNSTGLNASFWYLDPTTGSTGNYLADNASSGSSILVYNTSGSPSDYNAIAASGFIQPGQAFFVQNHGTKAPTLKFTEDSKSISSSSFAKVFGVTTPLSKLYITLLKNNGSTNSLVDGAAAAFSAKFTNTYGSQDAKKLNGSSDNLSITDKGRNLSIDGRLPATTNDVLPISLSALSGTTYKLVVNATTYTANGVAPYVVDAYNKTTSAINSIDTIAFTVDTKTPATYQNRFSIVFKPTTLAVNSIVVSASLKNTTATIVWNTVGENGVAAFTVEKSTDGISFTKIGEVSAKNTATASYTATDNDVVTTTSYYRIKAISTDGTISYSNTVKLTTNYSPLTSIYPNPLVGRILNIQLGNVEAGKYVVSITNELGQTVTKETISHSGGVGTHSINIKESIASGVYHVTISSVESKQFINSSTLTVN